MATVPEHQVAPGQLAPWPDRFTPSLQARVGPDGAGQGTELGADGAGALLVPVLPAVRADRGVLRPQLAAAGHREGALGQVAMPIRTWRSANHRGYVETRAVDRVAR